MQFTGENQCFICYSVSDQAFAAALASNLQSENFNIHFEKKDLTTETGRDGNDALVQCPCVIIIISPFAMIDRQVSDQIAFALEHKKKIITLVAEKCLVKGPLKKTKTIDFSTNYRKGLSDLAALLNKHAKAGTLVGIKTADVEPTNSKKDFFKSVMKRINVFKR